MVLADRAPCLGEKRLEHGFGLVLAVQHIHIDGANVRSGARVLRASSDALGENLRVRRGSVTMENTGAISAAAYSAASVMPTTGPVAISRAASRPVSPKQAIT